MTEYEIVALIGLLIGFVSFTWPELVVIWWRFSRRILAALGYEVE